MKKITPVKQAEILEDAEYSEENEVSDENNISEANDLSEGAEDSSGSEADYVRRPRVCLVAGFHSPTFSGRVASELLVAARGVELAVAASERQSYLHQNDFLISPFVNKVLARPDTGRYRLWVVPLFAMPIALDQGELWALTSFDPVNPDLKALKKLKGLPAIWVPSEAHAAACRRAGIRKDTIRPFPLPVNQRTFHPRVPCPTRYAPEKGVFRFIISASPLKRKGIEEVLRVYIKEFKAHEKVELVIKLTHFPKIKKDFDYEVTDLRKNLGALNNMFARVTVIAETLPELEYSGLLASADAYVAGNLSFNSAVTVKEAMACALPVIGPDYLKDLAGLTSERGFLVPTQEAAFDAGELYVNSPVCKVRKLDPEKLAAAMREAFTCCNKARKMGLVAQRWLKTQPDWKAFARDLLTVATARFTLPEVRSAE